MGRMHRRKGADFERKVAALLRKHWPGVIVRRAAQAHAAYESDVFISNGPEKLERLWLELQDARQPTPETKLRQAEHDISSLPPDKRALRLPVVVWHRTGERTSFATTRLWVLDAVRAANTEARHEVVTMPLEQFLDVLSGGVR